MKTFFKYTAFLITLIVVFAACSKHDEREGCTDPVAINYNSLAVTDDGTCEYLDSSFTIWSNGKTGFWGDEFTGAFTVRSCYTDTSTILLNPDSTFVLADTTIVPADTLIDNTVTPPDTSITPADTIIIAADTIITGDTYLLVNSDASGNYELIIQLLNKRNAYDFRNGYLIFNAKLHPDANIPDFEVLIHGNHLNPGGINCTTFLQSDPVVITSSALDTNSFREISVPIASFTNRHIQDIDLVFGIKGTNATPNTNLIIISSIKWVTTEDD